MDEPGVVLLCSNTLKSNTQRILPTHVHKHNKKMYVCMLYVSVQMNVGCELMAVDVVIVGNWLLAASCCLLVTDGQNYCRNSLSLYLVAVCGHVLDNKS